MKERMKIVLLYMLRVSEGEDENSPALNVESE